MATSQIAIALLPPAWTFFWGLRLSRLLKSSAWLALGLAAIQAFLFGAGIAAHEIGGGMTIAQRQHGPMIHALVIVWTIVLLSFLPLGWMLDRKLREFYGQDYSNRDGSWYSVGRRSVGANAAMPVVGLFYLPYLFAAVRRDIVRFGNGGDGVLKIDPIYLIHRRRSGLLIGMLAFSPLLGAYCFFWFRTVENMVFGGFMLLAFAYQWILWTGERTSIRKTEAEEKAARDALASR